MSDAQPIGARRHRALILFEQRRYDLAASELRQVAAAEPDDPFARALLALCLAEQEEFAEAGSQADEAVRLAPDLAFAHYARGSVLADRNRFAAAEQAAAEAVRLDPEDADAHALLARVYLGQEQWSAVLESAERGLAVGPEHAGLLNLRGVALRQLGRGAEAHATVDGALARNPEDAVAHANRGWMFLEQRQPQRALEAFREALRIEPGLEYARHGVVTALKARHAVYGLVLRYFLWMSKLDRRTRWMVIVGGFLGARVLRALARETPALGPVVWPILGTYVAFVLLTWVADPLFNLLLRVNRYGRLTLSRSETAISNGVGAAVAGAVASIIAAVALGDGRAWVAAAGCVALLIPLAGVSHCQPGWPRRAMTLYTAALVLLGAAALALALRAPAGAEPSDLAVTLTAAYFVGVVLSSWVANALIAVRPRR